MSRKDFASYGVQTFYVTDTIEEDAGGGNVRIFNYARIKGVLVPQFACIIAAPKLVIIGRKITNISQDVSISAQVRMPGVHVH